MCNFDPTKYTGAIGMFHCPECNQIVCAGLPHPSYEEFQEDHLVATKYPIWYCEQAPLEVYSDGEKFIAEIHAGIEGETILSVGYSSPNGADISGFSQAEVTQLAHEIDTWFNVINHFKEFDEMLQVLYDLCIFANKRFNKIVNSRVEDDD